MRIGHQGNPGLFKNCHRLLSGNARELRQKYIQLIAFLQVVKKIPNRHSRTCENSCAALNVGVNDDEGASHEAAPSADVFANVPLKILFVACLLI